MSTALKELPKLIKAHIFSLQLRSFTVMVNNKRDDIEVPGTSGLLGRIDCVNSAVQKATREVRTQQTN